MGIVEGEEGVMAIQLNELEYLDQQWFPVLENLQQAAKIKMRHFEAEF